MQPESKRRRRGTSPARETRPLSGAARALELKLREVPGVARRAFSAIPRTFVTIATGVARKATWNTDQPWAARRCPGRSKAQAAPRSASGCERYAKARQPNRTGATTGFRGRNPALVGWLVGALGLAATKATQGESPALRARQIELIRIVRLCEQRPPELPLSGAAYTSPTWTWPLMEAPSEIAIRGTRMSPST